MLQLLDLILVNGFSFFSFQEIIWQFIVTVLVRAHERERLYEPTTLVEQTMQKKGGKHILFKRFECSSFKHFIQHTSTREMSELVR